MFTNLIETQENEAQSRGLIAQGPPAHELRFKLLPNIIFTKLIETQARENEAQSKGPE